MTPSKAHSVGVPEVSQRSPHRQQLRVTRGSPWLSMALKWNGQSRCHVHARQNGCRPCGGIGCSTPVFWAVGSETDQTCGLGQSRSKSFVPPFHLRLVTLTANQSVHQPGPFSAEFRLKPSTNAAGLRCGASVRAAGCPLSLASQAGLVTEELHPHVRTSRIPRQQHLSACRVRKARGTTPCSGG